MPSADLIDHLEVILFSTLLAFTVMGVVASIVGTLTYLVTREPSMDVATAPTALQERKPDRAQHVHDGATAIAS